MVEPSSKTNDAYNQIGSDTLENGDLITHYLEKIGVKYVFGLPGGAIEPLFNAFARSESTGGVRVIVARHETGASFMADGYTRESGKLGVCCGTTGPGTTNLITGVASAYENEIPQLIITAQTALNTFGKGASQESSCTSVNTLGMFQHCTRYNSLISHSEQLEHKLVAAIMTAFCPPRGPVHLSIPIDILCAPAKIKDFALDVKLLRHVESLLDYGSLSKLVEEIVNAKKIVIVVGAGCNGASHAVLELATLLQSSIVTSIDGKGLINSYHPLYRGVFGFAGHPTAIEALRDPDVDLVIAMGTNLSELASGGWDEQSILNERLVHIDPVATHFLHSPMAKLQVVGAIDKVCQYLITSLQQVYQMENKTRDKGLKPVKKKDDKEVVILQDSLLNCTLLDPDKYNSDSTPIKPQRLMKELGYRFPPTTRFLADIGNSFAWATHYLHPIDRRLSNRRSTARSDFLVSGRRSVKQSMIEVSSYRSGIEFASMGWAIGSAVGTALANRDCPVVCITGDGSFLMSGQEITVAKQEELTVIYVILNDAALGMVKHGQLLSNAERIGYQLPKVDFNAFAGAMGINAFTIKSPEDFRVLDIGAICRYAGPTLLDVYIDPDELPPMGLRVKILEAAKKRSEQQERNNPKQSVAGNT